MAVIDFFGQLFFFVWFTSGIFWATASAAYASFAKINFKIAIPAGAIFQGVGFVGLLIYGFVKKQNQGEASPFEARQPISTQFAAATVNDPFGGNSANPFGDSSFGSATFGGQPFSSNNPFELAGQPQAKSSTSWINTLPGGFVLYGSLVVSIAFVWSLFLTWFNIITPNRITKGINAFSTGFDFWVFISIGALIAAVILCLKKPSLISAVILSWIGTWWLMLSVASLTARDIFVSAVDALFQIPNLLGSSDGYTQTWAFDIGAAWYVLFLIAIILIVSSAWIIAVSHRNRRSSLAA